MRGFKMRGSVTTRIQCSLIISEENDHIGLGLENRGCDASVKKESEKKKRV
jgi:hypothetical protein